MIVHLVFSLTFIAMYAINVMALLPGLLPGLPTEYELDPTLEVYEIGNGQRLPETPDELTTYCAARGGILKPTTKIMMDYSKLIAWFTSLWLKALKPDITLASAVAVGNQALPKINWVCERNSLETTKIINQYAIQAKQLKTAFIKHMWDLIQAGPQNTTWAHWLCICEKYMNQIAALHPDTDGTRQAVVDSLAPYSGALKIYSQTTHTTPDPVCDIQPPKQDTYPFTSYAVLYTRGINLFYKDPVVQGVKNVLNTAQGLASNLGAGGGAGILGGRQQGLSRGLPTGHLGGGGWLG